MPEHDTGILAILLDGITDSSKRAYSSDWLVTGVTCVIEISYLEEI
jgi:hypothetical protein